VNKWRGKALSVVVVHGLPVKRQFKNWPCI